jgi:hypothetical protein
VDGGRRAREEEGLGLGFVGGRLGGGRGWRRRTMREAGVGAWGRRAEGERGVGEADSRQTGKSRNKFLSPLRTF